MEHREASCAIEFTGAIYDPWALAPWMLGAALMPYPVNLGLSLHQAFGFGVPVVTSDRWLDHGPEFDALVDGETGLLYRAGDVGDLAAGWTRLLRDEPLRRRLAEGAHRRAIEVDTLPRMVQGFLDLLSIVDGERRSVETRETAA